MAIIIPEVPGVEVTIHMNGRAAVEYDDPKAPEKEQENKKAAVCTKFIECEDDSPFRIHLKVTDEYPWGYEDHCLRFITIIDGTTGLSKHCYESDTFFSDWKFSIGHLFRTDDKDQLVKQGFKFTGITQVEDADRDKIVDDLDRVAAGMGTIKVKVYRAIGIKSNNGLPKRYAPPVGFTLAEETLKGKTVSHGTGFSTPKKVVGPLHRTQSKPLPKDNGPIAVFQFMYRSKEALAQEGVIPPPQPNPDSQCLSEQKIKKEETEGTKSAPLAGLKQESSAALAAERLQQPKSSHTIFAHKRKREEYEDVKQERKTVKRG
ncbi:uncharacterized protein F4807DRAFT_60074 [Annulohypoxylon truncatum]|uniref:uncharacterized protein n=1 Tax=Annulohypoxylon truncatum TaxID=327061 RepID=UPI00200790F1|nr:uncharacterized protein F4807DRAFT_60074 [Annulohypoxylon truncatum]KAI1210304.1 hypothetical protein F4807DRAFT_60074 [Annulohypoxylon truncatum]